MGSIITCDNCEGTENEVVIEECDFCDLELCEECMMEHLGEEHIAELLEKIKKLKEENVELKNKLEKKK